MATLTATFQSKTLSRKITFSAVIPTTTKSIYDPENGAEKTSGSLQTLYLLHGWDGNHEDWLQNTRVVELANKYNVAVIMPSGENGFYVDHPGTNKYGAFIGYELVEETRRLFSLSNERADTWIAGLSMGGYGALRNGLKESGRFGKVAAFSSRILTCKDGDLSERVPNQQLKAIIGSGSYADMAEDMDIHWLAERVANSEIRPALYLACGSEDFLIEENRELHVVLEKLGYAHEYFESPGEHNWDFWNEYLEKALVWLIESE